MPDRPLLSTLRHLWAAARPHRDPEVAFGWFLDAEVARYDLALETDHPQRLDDDTWRDLGLGDYLDRLTGPAGGLGVASIFGRQMLYHRLRGGAPDPATAWTDPSPDVAARVRAALKPLRQADQEVAGALFSDPAPDLPRWVSWLWTVPAVLLAAVAALMLGAFALGGVLLVAGLIASATAQIKLHPALQSWQRQRRALLLMLQAAVDLAGPGAGEARRLLQRLRPGWVERLPAVAEYANLLALHEYRRLPRALAAWQAERVALQAVYRAVAGAEADAVIDAHRHSAQWLCPVATNDASAREGQLTGVIHPLLPSPQPLDVAWSGRGLFITGHNGAGKSTLLRTLGLNLVVARAFGFCYARQASLPPGRVISCLQVEDSLAEGRSLYQSELARALALLAAARAGGIAVVLIDEPFRGTNHLESVAATAAVVHALSRHAPVLLASHHLALAAALAGDLVPWCVGGSSDGTAQRSFSPGLLADTNGLVLMAARGFPADMMQDAHAVFGWLQEEMVHPSHPPPALTGA